MNPFVNIAVPKERVFDVYAFLLLERRGGAKKEEDEWTEELLERAYQESPSPMAAFLEHLARNPGQWFTAEEMADAIERSRAQMAGVLGAFGRRVKNRYSMETWPFHSEYNHAEGMATYAMDDDVAATMREVNDF